MGKGKRRLQMAAEAGSGARKAGAIEQKPVVSKPNVNQALEMGPSRRRRRKAEEKEKEAVLRMNKTGTTGYENDTIDEIAECERLVEFARQVEEGLHPRVKIPSHLHHLIERARIDPSNIHFSTNYYRVLRVKPHVKQDAIARAYADRWNMCSPISSSAQAVRKWKSGNPRLLHKVEKDWKRLQIAFKIISDTDLRARYDAGRPRFSSDKCDEFGVQIDSLLENKMAERVNSSLGFETEMNCALAGPPVPAIEQRIQQYELPVRERASQPETKIKREVLSPNPFEQSTHRAPPQPREKSRGPEIKHESFPQRQRNTQRSHILGAQLNRQVGVSRKTLGTHGYDNERSLFIVTEGIRQPTIKRESEEFTWEGNGSDSDNTFLIDWHSKKNC